MLERNSTKITAFSRGKLQPLRKIDNCREKPNQATIKQEYLVRLQCCVTNHKNLTTRMFYQIIR
jgi:hypothetical protein